MVIWSKWAMADGPKKYPRKSTAAKKREARKQPTPRQSRFAKALMKSKNLVQAAIPAGYSPKNASQSAHQALTSLKVPDMLNNAGYSIPVIIEKHLAPKLSAKTTKLAIHDGKFTDFVDLEDHGTQMQAIDTMLKMHGAYAPKDVELAAQVGVKVVVVDMPRPTPGVVTDDIRPGQPIILPPRNGSKNNGHK